MGPCAVRMGPGAGWSKGWVMGGPWRRGAAGAGRRDSGEPAAAAITAATARGLGSRPPARDLGSSLEKVNVLCRGGGGGGKREGEVILWPSKPHLSPGAPSPRTGSSVPNVAAPRALPPAPRRPWASCGGSVAGWASQPRHLGAGGWKCAAGVSG